MLEVEQALLSRFGVHTQPHHYQLLDGSLKLLLDPAPGEEEGTVVVGRGVGEEEVVGVVGGEEDGWGKKKGGRGDVAAWR